MSSTNTWIEANKLGDYTNKYFAFVIDGEVTHVHLVDTRLEKLMAVMQSNPTIIQIPDELGPRMATVDGEGWSHVDGEFVETPIQ